MQELEFRCHWESKVRDEGSTRGGVAKERGPKNVKPRPPWAGLG